MKSSHLIAALLVMACHRPTDPVDATCHPGDAATPDVAVDAPSDAGADAPSGVTPDASGGIACSSNGDCTQPGQCCNMNVCGPGTPFGELCIPM